MSEFILQPNVYRTGLVNNLMSLLETVWIRNFTPGQGSIYILSGFGNFNGGVRFFSIFRRHVDSGGCVHAIFGGSTSQRLTSSQLVKQLLSCGCQVNIVSRKKIFHTKCYGNCTNGDNNLIVSSGNFTGPGMSQNVESAIYLGSEITTNLNFQWAELIQSIHAQDWDIYQPSLEDPEGPGWSLLYDEREEELSVDETKLMTMILTLGHSDTVRINATRRTNAAKGSQYFWLSRDCYDFFPPLSILNTHGVKETNSCLINLHYVDLGLVHEGARVTFEAGNNVDFRLGTGKYRYTRLAQIGGIAAISRISEYNFDIQIINQGAPEYNALLPYATTFIGHQGKRIGYLSNERFEEETGIQITSEEDFRALL